MLFMVMRMELFYILTNEILTRPTTGAKALLVTGSISPLLCARHSAGEYVLGMHHQWLSMDNGRCYSLNPACP